MSVPALFKYVSAAAATPRAKQSRLVNDWADENQLAAERPAARREGTAAGRFSARIRNSELFVRTRK